MWLVTLLILVIFIAAVALIITDTYNRAVVAMAGAILSYFVMVFLGDVNPLEFARYLVGSEDDNYVNIQSLTLILGMSIIVNISHYAGVFRYLAFKFVQVVAKKPTRLMPILCLISFILSAILNNILTVMILIPLTITISRMLNFDPEPYILTQAILVNVGGTLFSISSIPNILIVLSRGIEFDEFFINVGLFSIIAFTITTILFYAQYRKGLYFDEKNLSILMEFDPMNFIKSKSLFRKSLTVLVIVLISFVFIPNEILSPNLIALTGAIILTIISKMDQKTIIENIDTELFLYLMGVFVIAGCIESAGIIEWIGQVLLKMSFGNPIYSVLIILWSSAILSSAIDNIPITKILIPVVSIMVADLDPATADLAFYALVFGANWGDNLTPMGDNILVMNLAQKNKRPISAKRFFQLGFITTIYQLLMVSIYLTIRLGSVLSLFFIILLGVLIVLRFYRNSEEFFGKKWKIPINVKKIGETLRSKRLEMGKKDGKKEKRNPRKRIKKGGKAGKSKRIEKGSLQSGDSESNPAEQTEKSPLVNVASTKGDESEDN